MKRLFIEKGSSNRANKVLEVSLWVSYIFGLKQKFWRERVLGIEILSKVVSKKTREKQKLDFFWMKNIPYGFGIALWVVFLRVLGSQKRG